ncbi:hypothetical protein X907_2314 [Glycocaulis alkaliphilus]|uniref:Uncharacterized protein n=1 Tax=Glycocaulis alkaliphilus TaxID=1434191 RepID=A0A3T0EBU5_9PROT|nr:hypothetical protein [Glycocaulis alkaliphilus]AZU04829.1 hypothetical protein X907_2314 [Glycocaulis alkaliphilus]GGB67377.1 hypothetical protein GCM10007417_03940 [Glycocaulis alkaliphilus]
MPEAPDSSDLSIERFELEGANVFCARLIGTHRLKDSLVNAQRLAERVVRENRDAVILDYSQCQLEHKLEEFIRVGDLFVRHMPAHVRFSYVYHASNMMHAAYMTKILHKAGFKARAFGNWADAERFARGID